MLLHEAKWRFSRKDQCVITDLYDNICFIGDITCSNDTTLPIFGKIIDSAGAWPFINPAGSHRTRRMDGIEIAEVVSRTSSPSDRASLGMVTFTKQSGSIFVAPPRTGAMRVIGAWSSDGVMIASRYFDATNNTVVLNDRLTQLYESIEVLAWINPMS